MDMASAELLQTLSIDELMAILMFREAGIEPAVGKLAVGHTVLNRAAMNRPHYGGQDFRAIILMPYQYSCFNADQEISTYYDEESEIVAALLMAGYTKDPSGGATHYFNPDIVRKVPDSYAERLTERRIGRHIFYRPRWG